MLLYRPVGLHELRLIYESGLRAFPSRLPEQPIFYPVLHAGHAEQIAREWNATQTPFAGYVTRFTVRDAYASQFERRQVGGRQHEELWVPAETLAEFNANLEGRITVEAGYFGPGFTGEVPDRGLLAQRPASQQLRVLSDALGYSMMDFTCEIGVNHRAVFLNFAAWLACPAEETGLSDARRDEVTRAIRAWWGQRDTGIDLPDRGAYVA